MFGVVKDNIYKANIKKNMNFSPHLTENPHPRTEYEHDGLIEPKGIIIPSKTSSFVFPLSFLDCVVIVLFLHWETAGGKLNMSKPTTQNQKGKDFIPNWL